jgi:hypothetical protein
VLGRDEGGDVPAAEAIAAALAMRAPIITTAATSLTMRDLILMWG